jgi:hypothetical protein
LFASSFARRLKVEFHGSRVGRFAGYEDVNDADRLAHDPAMRAVVDRQGRYRSAASSSQMGCLETGWPTSKTTLSPTGC